MKEKNLIETAEEEQPLLVEESSNSQEKDTINETLILEPEKEKEVTFEDLKKIKFDEIYKKNLIFREEKAVGLFELMFHVTNFPENILLILGIILSIGSGAGKPLIPFLIGKTINIFASASKSNIVDLTTGDKETVYYEFEKKVEL